MALAPGTRLGPYEILEPLGAGGMGEVYRAKDPRIDRTVALKVLPEELFEDEERRARFGREARTLASLNHPGIAVLYSFEEVPGPPSSSGSSSTRHLLVMELVEGEGLDQKIAAGPLPLEETVSYARQIAEALAAAHEKGIVHRDLKPANVVVMKDGRAKILDFGLAKVAGSGDSAKADTTLPTDMKTREGVVMGTVPYMSPEQVSGRPLDHRTDIFSLGVILYEMVTGQRPFQGDSSAELISSILRDTPRPPGELRRGLPGNLGRIVQRCLEKSAADRIQSARQVLDGLRGLTAEAPATPTPSAPAATPTRGDSGPVRADEGFWVAVLPFKSSGDAEMGSFADGLGEEITTGLSRFRYLSVVTSASAARLKGEAGDERALAARLGARYMLEGSIRKGGSAVRVSAQLTDALTGAQLWAETYNRDLQASSIFAAQDDIAARIVATVADSYGVLVHSMRSAMRQKDDVHLTAVEWQFQYFAYREQITPSAYAELKSRLERAVERDGRQSDLWACLAQIFVDEYAFGFGTDPAALERALAAARRAVELDRANQFALVALAQTHFFRQDLAAFGPAAERAMALNPLNTDAVGILGLQIVHTGEFERGAAIVRRAMELNANHAGWMHFAPLWEHFHKGEYEQALERANRVDVPGLFWPYLVVASACGHLGRRAEAAAAVRDLLALDPEFAAHARSNVGTWHFASGLMEPILEGLRKAGLSIPATGGSSDSPGREVTAKIGDKAGASAAVKVPDSIAVRAEEGFWVAVLPFKYSGNNAELTALAEGLTEDIVTGLSRFSYLRVIARSSTSRYGNESVDVRSVGKELGARYVMEGSLRQGGTKLRLSAQLVDASSGAHLWAENYERAFSPEAVFELQDDLVPRIVSTVADMNGVLPRSMSEVVRSRDPEQLSPYEAVLRSFGYLQRVTPEDLGAARSGLEMAVRKAPAYADAWAMLAFLCVQEYGQGFKLQADPLTGGAAAARRALEADPSNALAYFSLAQALFFQKDLQSFRNAAERAIALNPMDGNSIAFLGELLTYAGDEERGLALAGRAKQLNPNHPGWYWYADFYNAYRHGDYRGALGFVLKSNLPGHWGMHAAVAAAHGQLEDRDAAAKAMRDLLKLRPDFAAEVRAEFEKWWEPAYVESFLDGLRKAGLEIDSEKEAAAPALGNIPDAPAKTESGAARADEGFWVAVLPFKSSGSSAGLTALAEALSEEIVTGLSRFSYLRVMARGATSRLASGAADVRTVAREIGARYVMEGSLRQAGSRLRVAMQLTDATTGAHLWAETYDRPFNADDVFALQDDLVPRIVSTCADHFGVLARSISDSVRGRESDRLSPYEALMRGFGYHQRLTSAEHAEAREVLERAVERAPANADCWAMLSWIYSHEYAHGFNVRPGSLVRALAAARRAVDIAPSNHLAQQALAVVLFFRKETAGCLSAAERAIALNPLDASNEAIFLITFTGDWERGCALIRRAIELNPHHPRWYGLVLGMNEYRMANYRAAVDEFVKANAPDVFWTNWLLAAAHGQLGELAAARNALRDLLAQKEDFAQSAGELMGKWFEPQMATHLIEGLRKAGLDLPSSARADPPVKPTAAVAIAVLPFTDMSPAKDQEYLCEGMAEEIMNALVQIDGIRVASRTSAFRARKDGGDLPAIARALSVGHVLEGSVRTAGDRLRVTAQLTDVASGFQLWSERFDRKAEDVFAVQDEIAMGVVEAVRSRLGAGGPVIQARPQVRNLEAYQLYLKGRHLRFTKNDHGGALLNLERAVALEPSHGPSWVALADIHVLAAAYGIKPSSEANAEAKNELATAARLQGETGDARYVEGMIAFSERRWADADRAMARAMQIEPGNVQARCWIAMLLSIRGRTEEAIEALERAREIDPLAPYPYAMTGFCLLNVGRAADAGRFARQALAFDEDNILALWVSGAASVSLGQFDQAVSSLERAATRARANPFTRGTLGWVLAAAGRIDEAHEVLEALRARAVAGATVLSEAWLLAALEDMDGAFEVLRLACEEKQLLVPFTGMPGFDPLRSDPRFAAIVERMRLPSTTITA